MINERKPMDFVAIDFETATQKKYSACAIGIVTVEDDKIVDQYCTLIQPPGNEYKWFTTKVHGLTGKDTASALSFREMYPEIKKRIKGKKIIAHNESFDRGVMRETCAYYKLDYSELKLPEKWECTMKIYKAMGYKPARLDACCEKQGIELNHHEALSDARGCALLYLKKDDQVTR